MNHHLFFHSNWKLLPGLDQLSKLKHFNWNSSLKISPSIFSPTVKFSNYLEKSTRQRSSETEVEDNVKTSSTKKITEPKFYLQRRSNVNPACAKRNWDSSPDSPPCKTSFKTTPSISTKELHSTLNIKYLDENIFNLKTSKGK